MTGAVISTWIDPVYGAESARIGRGLAALLHMAGITARAAGTREAAQLVYAPDDRSLQVTAAPSAWQASASCAPRPVSAIVVPECAVVDGRVDPVRAADFFLSGAHEPGLEQAGMEVPGAKIARWKLDTIPVVDHLARDLVAALAPLGVVGRPRWPHGKRWAMALSHDCDRPYLFRPLGFARDAAGFAAALDVRRAARSAAQAAYCAAGKLWRRDPYVESMRAFAAFERRIGLRGTYYFGVASRYENGATVDDLPYDERDRTVRALAREMADAGMEIGLHSSINAWRHSEGFARERERFAAAYGVAPAGVRGHFWSLDKADSAASLAAIAAAGFRYDSSFGMNECGGYRRGTAYPFLPIGASAPVAGSLIEIPPVLMDDSLPASAGAAAVDAAFDALAGRAREYEGALVLDWHSDTLTNPRWSANAGHALDAVERLAGDSDCWLASVEDIARWSLEERWND